MWRWRVRVPGDIVAVAKVDEIHYDAVLHDAAEDDHIHLKPLNLPVPVHGLAIEPKRHGDEQRMWEILGKLVDEDPCLKVEHVAATNETIVYGLGDLHLRVLLDRLREIYKFEVSTRPPRIAYRETVTANAEGHHRHKKQTGGAGQFGEVFLKIEPLPRGGGFEFVDQVKGGTIPTQYIPAVEKGVREALASGVIAGYTLVDVRVIVYDGKHHSVDSKDIAFATAGRKAFMDAVRAARPIVLEPVAVGRDHRARTCDGRHRRRPVVTPRPGQRHRQQRLGLGDDPRPGAAGRTRGLPVAAERDDQRPGPLRAGAVPLRPGAADRAGATDVTAQGQRRRVNNGPSRGRRSVLKALDVARVLEHAVRLADDPAADLVEQARAQAGSRVLAIDAFELIDVDEGQAHLAAVGQRRHAHAGRPRPA